MELNLQVSFNVVRTRSPSLVMIQCRLFIRYRLSIDIIMRECWTCESEHLSTCSAIKIKNNSVENLLDLAKLTTQWEVW